MDTLAGWPSIRTDIPDDVAFHFGADRAIGTAHDVGLEDRASSHWIHFLHCINSWMNGLCENNIEWNKPSNYAHGDTSQQHLNAINNQWVLLRSTVLALNSKWNLIETTTNNNYYVNQSDYRVSQTRTRSTAEMNSRNTLHNMSTVAGDIYNVDCGTMESLLSMATYKAGTLQSSGMQFSHEA